MLGTAEYQVFGWTASAKTAGYLVLLTLANLTSFVILGIGMFVRDKAGDPLPRFDPTDTETLIYSSDPRGELLHKITANKNDPGPGNEKTRFGRGDDGTVRLWVGDRDEVVSLIFTRFHYLHTRNLGVK